MRAEFGGDRQFLWLASYPKSGSTWLRAMLAALAQPEDPIDLGALPYGMELFERQPLDDFAAIATMDLHVRELIPYQARFFAAVAHGAEQPVLAKTHAAAIAAGDGTALFSSAVSAGAIYLLRDPLDVAVSYAHHDGRTIDEIVARMGDPQAALHLWPHKAGQNLPQLMGSWNDHVTSWTAGPDFPVLVLKYEDMLDDPAASLAKAADFCGWAASPDDIAQAVAKCAFNRLSAAERSAGFGEKPSEDRPFFRGGRKGDGRNALSDEQVERICLDNAVMMRQFAYLR